MSHRDIYEKCGLAIPNNVQFFDDLHTKLNSLNFNNIYEFLSKDPAKAKINANLLEGAANTKLTTTDDDREIEICNILLTLFRGSNANSNKTDYDTYRSSLQINIIFDEIINNVKPDMTLSRGFCTRKIDELTSILKLYPNRPDSESVFRDFCTCKNIIPDIASDEVRDKDIHVIKEIVIFANEETAKMVKKRDEHGKNLDLALHQKDNILNNYNLLTEKRLGVVNRLECCDKFLISAKEIKPLTPDSTSIINYIPVEQKFVKMPQVLQKAARHSEGFLFFVSAKIRTIIDPPDKGEHDIKIAKSCIDNITESRISLHNLDHCFEKLYSNHDNIFASVEHSDVAERNFENFKTATAKAEEMCNNADAKHKSGNLILEEAIEIQSQIQKLSDEVNSCCESIGECLKSINGIVSQYSPMLEKIEDETYRTMRRDPIVDIVKPQVEKFKQYEKIGYAIFGVSLFFSLGSAIRVYHSLFTLNFSWQHGTGTFQHMFIVMVAIPFVFMIIRTFWMDFFSKRLYVFDNVSQSFDSIKESMQIWKESFGKTYEKVNFLAFLNFAICLIAFVIYVLMVVGIYIFA